jgi:hypothetical protein
MLSGQVHTLTLVCHPLTPCGAHCSVEARVERSGSALGLEYRVTGDIEALRMPPPSAPRRADDLWKHTCCELFVAHADPAYIEFNFSPSGEWAAYAFRDYRERIANADIVPKVRAVRHEEGLTLEATVPLSGKVKLGLSAVLEEKDGTLSYWALCHAPGKPDFHHPDAFAFEIDEARA